MKKIINLLSIILIILTIANFIKSQELIGDELTAAKNLVYQINKYDIANPCQSQMSIEITCKLDTETNLYHVNSIFVYGNATYPNPDLETTPFKSFKNCTYIYISNGINIIDDIFSNLPEFSNKATIYISSLNITIDPNIKLPSNLNKITIERMSVPLPASFFSDGVEELVINDPLPEGFKYPSAIPTNNINYFELPITYFSQFPTDGFKSFIKCINANVYINNDATQIGYKNYSLPEFNFPAAIELNIYFSSYSPRLALLKKSLSSDTQYQLFEFDKIVATSLNSLKISGVGFKLPKSNYVDFSNLNSGVQLDFQYYSGFIDSCISKPCIKLPQNVTLTIYSGGLNYSYVDFSSTRSLEVYHNTIEDQSLPTGFNYSMNPELNIQSGIRGILPEEYCKFKLNNLKLYNITFSGTVPDCFQCLGGYYFKNSLFPSYIENSFPNFNQTTPASSCPTFNIDMNYNQLAKTDGSSKITIYGTDFGWETGYLNIQIAQNGGKNKIIRSGGQPTPDELEMDVSIPNYQLIWSIPQGVGANFSHTYYFGYENSFERTFTFSYEAPYILGYRISISGSEITLSFNGSNFDYNDYNTVNINDVDFGFFTAADPYTGGISYVFKMDEIAIGDSITVYAVVGGQKSNTVDYKIYSQLSLDTPKIKLNSTGGDLKLTGSFSTATIGEVLVSINGVKCTVKSVDSTSITITYPSIQSVGVYPITVTVGGQLLDSEVEYVQSETPTPPITPTPTSSDEPSSSSMLSISLLTIVSLILLSSF